MSNKSKIKGRVSINTGKPAKLPPKDDYRVDGWANPMSGQGITDKSRGKTYVVTSRLGQQQLSMLYSNDWLARKVCEKPAKDATRKGIIFKEKANQDLQNEFTKHKFFMKSKEGISWGRLYGGAAMIFIVDDGRQAHEPLEFKNVKSLIDVMVVDRFYLSAEGINTDYLSVDYGLPSHYRLNGGISYHASRIAKFNGAPLTYDKRMENQGWGGSYVQLYWDAISDFQSSMGQLQYLMSESSLGILSVPRLTDAKAMGGKAEKAVMNRSEVFNIYKSMFRTAVIDTDEKYEYVNRSLAGLAELADRFATNLSGAVDIPQLELFGTTPSGLNASQEEQVEMYQDMISSLQGSCLQDAISKFIGCITRGKEIVWEFKPLSQLTDSKLAEVRNKESQTLAAIVDLCGFTPEMCVQFLNDTGHFQIEVPDSEGDLNI